ncbi:MAG: Asp-tRNA(Asn)/Glu-tRNA(Gln) amidotransferase subunit GatC [Bacillota bacterium]
MKFDRKEIEHIAELARLELSSEELDLYGGQLSAITGYIEQLKEAPEREASSSSSLKNVWREDKVLDRDEQIREGALSQGEREAGLIKVKRVL